MPPADAPPPSLPPLGGLRAIVAGIEALATTRRDAVLCVVVATGGSTYRKPGALILLDAGGVHVGALSGGCLEAELEAQARDVFADGVARPARFDTSGDEDRVFGSGTGCGGSTEVLLLPLPPKASPLRSALRAAVADDLDLELSLVGGERAGAGVACVGEQRFAFDECGAPLDDEPALDHAWRLRIARVPRLLLLGAGPETPPLLAATRRLGWHATLCEQRDRWLRYADHAGVDTVHRDGVDVLADPAGAARFDAALVMNHHFDLDARSLRALADMDVGYVGLLGPIARRDELLAGLDENETARLQPRLHAPVGLSLGGEGPEAIAMAIAAELQQVHAQATRA